MEFWANRHDVKFRGVRRVTDESEEADHSPVVVGEERGHRSATRRYSSFASAIPNQCGTVDRSSAQAAPPPCSTQTRSTARRSHTRQQPSGRHSTPAGHTSLLHAAADRGGGNVPSAPDRHVRSAIPCASASSPGPPGPPDSASPAYPSSLWQQPRAHHEAILSPSSRPWGERGRRRGTRPPLVGTSRYGGGRVVAGKGVRAASRGGAAQRWAETAR